MFTQATEESIEKLIKNASLAVQEMYPTLKRDIAILEVCKGNVSPLLELVPELRMNVKFILVDMATSFHALLSAKSAVEKRLQIENIRADMHECYKLLYGFGNVRQYTAWSKLGKQLQQLNSDIHDELYTLLLSNYDTITALFENLESSDEEKTNRDLTYHYDDDLLKVYQNILDSSNEEKVSQRLISYFDLWFNVLLLCDQIEAVEVSKGQSLPEIEVMGDSLVPTQDYFAEYLKANVKFQESLSQILQDAAQIDNVAKMRKGIVRIKDFAQTKDLLMDFHEADDMDVMSNMQLLIRIMLVDIATTVNAYIHSGSNPEYAFNLRKLTIIRVSTLSLLVGYGEAQKADSLWKRIVKMIPTGDKTLEEEAAQIEGMLESLVVQQDNKDRTLFAHPMNKKKNNVKAILEKIEKMNPVKELNKAETLIKATTRVQYFLKMLMDKLAEKAHKESIESTAKLMAKIQAFRDIANHPQCPEQVKIRINDQMDKIVELINRI